MENTNILDRPSTSGTESNGSNVDSHETDTHFVIAKCRRLVYLLIISYLLIT